MFQKTPIPTKRCMAHARRSHRTFRVVDQPVWAIYPVGEWMPRDGRNHSANAVSDVESQKMNVCWWTAHRRDARPKWTFRDSTCRVDKFDGIYNDVSKARLELMLSMNAHRKD